MIDKETVKRFATGDAIPAQFHLMIPQEGVTHTVLPESVKHNAIWDYSVSPDGRHFLSVCAEGSFSQFAHMYEYLPETGELVRRFKLDEVVTTHYRAIRPSKFHSSFSFMPNGKLIMTTHTTATAPNHPEWLPYAYYTHQWEGYPGSNILTYDLQTGEVEDLGIPVPRTTIYGGVYEPTSNAYYFGDYMRGHVYKFSLDDRSIKDYGQCTEYASFRYIVGPDNNVYFSSKAGAFQRINTQKDCVEDTGIRFPVYEDVPLSYVHNQMMFAEVGPDGKLYISAAYGPNLLRYDFATNTLEQLGRFAPPEFREFNWGSEAMTGICFDEDGRLWYNYNVANPCWLCSWDVANDPDAIPVLHGLMGSPERRVGYVCEMHIRDGVLYAADTNHDYDPPGILAMDLAAIKAGKATVPCLDPYQYLRSKNGPDLYPGDLVKDGERFYKDMLRGADANVFHQANGYIFGPTKYLTKVWKEVPIEESSVVSVSYDSDNRIHAVTAGCCPHHVVIKDGHAVLVDETPAPAAAANDAAKLFEGITLPAQPGRQYLAVATAWAPLSDGRRIVGTSDGMVGIEKDGKVFALGACAPHGPIHQIVATADGKTAYGVAGDSSDLGTVFSYDDERGLTIYGKLYSGSPVSVGGLGASCEPCCLALSADETRLAIGARDRMGCVYEYDLAAGIKHAHMWY